MIRLNFLTAWRNIRRNSFYSILNITGLAIGLAVSILILLWVRDELSFDGFHKHSGFIYRIDSHLGTGPSAEVWDGAPPAVATYCRQSVPEVARAVRIQPIGESRLIRSGSSTFIETSSAYVDPDFFTMFDFPLAEGDRNHPFGDDHSLVITRSTAKKYFNDSDPMGRTLVVDGSSQFTVTGVLDDFPDNTSIHYDMLYPMSLLAHSYGSNGVAKTLDDDPNYTFTIYLQLEPNALPVTVAKKVTNIYQQRSGDHSTSNFFALHPLRDIHLVSTAGDRSALSIVRIFAAVGILILLIAGINYVNLSTARSILRSKEVSIRKIIGARRRQLFFQFVTESCMLFVMASILALIMISLLLPTYNNLTGKHLVFSLADPGIWLTVASTTLGALIAASIYPALLLSAFRPIEAIRGKSVVAGVSNASFRKILVVMQFTFSVGLILSTLVIRDQLKYIREKNLGFDQSEVFTIKMHEGMRGHYTAIVDQLTRFSSVENAAISNNSIAGHFNTAGNTWWEGKDPSSTFLINFGFINERFLPTLKLQLAAGKNFTGTPADSGHYIMNETAIRAMGMKDPIGKAFSLDNVKGTIIGVVQDFHFKSLKERVSPLVFSSDSAEWSTIYVRTRPGQAADAIAKTRQLWHEYDAAYPFSYSFLSDDFDRMYRADQRIGFLFNVFAIIAIVISCLGLFGLATYSAQIRTREIGIRRVLGATAAQMTVLLAKNFIGLISISFLIAAPVAGWLMNGWLHNYAYRTSLSVLIFAWTFGLILLVALLTIGVQTVRAALTDPAKSLRTE